MKLPPPRPVSLSMTRGTGQAGRSLCQDATRGGLKTGTGKVILAGVKPIVSVPWGRENFWIYGVMELLNPTKTHKLEELHKIENSRSIKHCR